jgi:glutathionylspermidine synthase
LPREAPAFEFLGKEAAYYILKPSAGTGGHGIHILRGRRCALEYYDQNCNFEEYVVQEYACRPALFEGRKFDIR